MLFSMTDKAARAGTMALVCLGMLAASPALAQSTPYLDYSDLYGYGGTIAITRLPIKLSNGDFVYMDATLAVTADSMGNLKAKVTKQSVSPVLNTANIQAGVYYEAQDYNSEFRISGPGPLGDGAEAKWTVVTESGYPCGSPAEFYTGQLDQNPLYTRLQAAGITDSTYSYGIMYSGSSCSSWPSNALVGFAQIGSQIEADLFTDPKTGKDQNTPYARYLYNYLKK